MNSSISLSTQPTRFALSATRFGNFFNFSSRQIWTFDGARRTPIIALTANALDEDRDACLAAGMDGFLTKPLARERLTDVLATVRGRASLAA